MQMQAVTINVHEVDKPIGKKPKPITKTLAYIIVYFLTKLILMLVTMGLIASYLIPLAFEQRGYYAIGGEWLLIAGSGFIVWFGLDYLLKEDEN